MSKAKSEIVNGVESAVGWGEVLRISQENPSYLIDGEPFKRIPFGEDLDLEQIPHRVCRDCVAAPGQFHVPGCCIEYCPRCKGQAISCGCFCPFTVDFSPFETIDGEVQE